MAKIAVNNLSHPTAQANQCGSLAPRCLAAGDGWSIFDVICTAGPKDRAFEEQHSQLSIAVVLSGTFQYQTSTGRELMTPGSLLLGNPRESFQCSHEHGTGDRCISFHFSEEFCDRSEIPSRQRFRSPRIPALRALSPVVANATRLLGSVIDNGLFQETALQVLSRATQVQLASRYSTRPPSARSLARVTEVLREIEAHPEAPHDLSQMAASIQLSPYHFLRCFEEVTGTTPRQYLLRARLHRAATRLKQETTKIIDIALGCGFGDVSNFNRTFRSEFGQTPRTYRRS